LPQQGLLLPSPILGLPTEEGADTVITHWQDVAWDMVAHGLDKCTVKSPLDSSPFSYVPASQAWIIPNPMGPRSATLFSLASSFHASGQAMARWHTSPSLPNTCQCVWARQSQCLIGRRVRRRCM
jgi:hypothetical protein